MCQSERLYLGHESRSPPPRTTPAHAEAGSLADDKAPPVVDSAYRNHTALSSYMPYMMGGGYVLSHDLVRLVLEVNSLGRGDPGAPEG